MGGLFALFACPAEARTLKLITYNVAGVPFFNPLPEKINRLAKIAKRLKTSEYEIVALQEVWTKKDANLIKKLSGYPYCAVVNNNGPFGNGLMILSRHPIKEVHLYNFTFSEPFNDFLDPEFWSAKAVMAVRLDMGGREIDLYNTHLVASTPNTEHIAIRHTQVYDIAEAVRDFSAGRPYILTGDFNFPPRHDAYRILKGIMDVHDACDENKPGACAPTNEDGRIDYVFLSGHFPAKAVLARKNDFFWKRRHPFFELSDHLAFAVEIDLSAMGQKRAYGAGSLSLAGKKQAYLAIRASNLDYLKKIARRHGERHWIPLYNYYHTLFISKRVVAMMNMDRNIALLLDDQKTKGIKRRVLRR
ncbi:MAG: endonuclease/exonuclease/phosphatase family protein [Elusimicrobia bacterium]|nr:endonuclease/exonuclease/phosphatase family protein [Elusimicrobiota bacterium]